MRLLRALPILFLFALPISFASADEPLAISSSTIDGMEKRLSVLDKEIEAQKLELSEIGPKRASAGGRAKTRGRVLYKMMRAGLMPLGGGFTAFVDHAQRVERLKHSIKLDLDEEAILGTRARTLAASIGKLIEERAQLGEKKAILDAARVAIDEEKRRREAFERAFATSTGALSSPVKSDGEIVVYGPSGKMAPESIDPGSFRARKGRLTFPVAGQAEVKATTKEGGPAIEIKAALGSTVRAVHPGRVAFADRYGTYGSLVILDHGDRCYTVSANLGTIDVKAGDEISSGEKLGTVGDDGRGPSLYFEVRIGNDKVPPGPWLGL
jgi:septal ring factor EnvC (AmiA/AmiB activator)